MLRQPGANRAEPAGPERLGRRLCYPRTVTDEVRFPGVVGHARVQTMLARAMGRGRLHHGLVLVGPRGVGKATLARGLACALICSETPGQGCGECNACARVLAHHHTDFVVVEAEGKGNIIRVEQAEEIGLRSQHAPFESKAHVIVFDPADRLHESAANKLLKAIEEPREGVYYVLLTTNEREIIPTILSRCMVLQVDRLDEDSARTVVDRELQSRELEVGADRVRVAVQLSQGCPGVALELITDESLDAARELTAAAIDAAIEGPPAIFGGSKSPLWLAWDEAVKSIKEEEPEDDADAVIVVKGKGKRRKRKAKKSSGRSDVTPAKQRAAAGRLAELWLLHVREQLRGAKGLEGLPKLTGLGSAKLARQVERVQAFQESLLRNPNVRLALEQTLLELSA